MVDGLKNNPLGSLYFKLRPRYEYAKINGFEESNALTLRTVAGFGSRTWSGFSFLVEGEGVFAVNESWYFDGTGAANRHSLVPDPRDIDFNQGYLHYEKPDWTANARLGRQRIIYDDARFVGNVGWRQNEQTFDAVSVSTGLGRKEFELSYTYVEQVLRIFGNRGSGPTRDFDANNHFIRFRWSDIRGRTLGLAPGRDGLGGAARGRRRARNAHPPRRPPGAARGAVEARAVSQP